MVRQIAVEQGIGSNELDKLLVPDEAVLRPVDFEKDQEVGEEEKDANED